MKETLCLHLPLTPFPSSSQEGTALISIINIFVAAKMLWVEEWQRFPGDRKPVEQNLVQRKQGHHALRLL